VPMSYEKTKRRKKDVTLLFSMTYKKNDVFGSWYDV
jgi:hypothetical protein